MVGPVFTVSISSCSFDLRYLVRVIDTEYILYVCRSCASYSPNAEYILASSLNSSHRLIPIGGEAAAAGNGGASGGSELICYSGHVNEKYSISSSIYSNPHGDFILSGSEDGKVRSVDCVFRFILFGNI